MLMTLDQSVFARRRAQLMSKMPDGSVALIAANRLVTRNRDAEYAFRQDSSFYYLTGFNEPDALLVLLPGRDQGRSILFCQPRDPAMEIWTGFRAGPEGCVSQYGMDQAFTLCDIDKQLPDLLDGTQALYYAWGQSAEFDAKVMNWLKGLREASRQGRHAPSQLGLIDDLLHEMRLFKDDAEIALMQRAADISAHAHIRAMQVCRPGVMEYQLEAEIQHYCAMQGARFQAYTPIVGGGQNACILHYIENSAELKDGDLVLIDAGCELDCYASDITRTFPVNGRFSPEQKALYGLVLDVQKQCIEAIKPGTPWNAIHDLSVRLLTEGLLELGLLKGEVDQLIEAGAYKPFYMHRIGHWLGMDVHDVGAYKQKGDWRPLEEGMVMTVEPGLYIAADNQDVDPRWRGIGIRIEDDVLVTATGHHVLTASVPKEIDEIEALMAR
ncbi:Xaa-Pro aminopeptidase [Nitrincola alkalisediminis]|uniref:Xaa-Pro aminopeptidase n=1 Tax=Nitrincola alkalisediminis TaxID=1366656 RepID=UPI0031B6317F